MKPTQPNTEVCVSTCVCVSVRCVSVRCVSVCCVCACECVFFLLFCRKLAPPPPLSRKMGVEMKKNIVCIFVY